MAERTGPSPVRRVKPASLAMRIAFAVAGILLMSALAMQVGIALRSGTANWPAIVNIAGVLIIAVVGVIDPPMPRLRFALALFALALIVPSAVLLWVRVFGR